MKHLLLVVVILVALFYVGACAWLYLYQRSFIYFPPAVTADPAATVVTVSVPGAELKLVTRPHAGPKALLYFGGNGENVSYQLPSLSVAFPDRAIYLVNYRGYGGSSGQPSEKNFHADAESVFDTVHATHPDILVIGRSLGSGVATRLASVRPVRRLALVTPYDSLQELAARQFPFFPVSLLLQDKFESWRYAPRVSAPTLILMAESDGIVPRDSSERLLNRFASGIAQAKVLPGTDHNSISESPDYLPALKSIE